MLKVKVSHEFKDTYDSASVMVMKDLSCWAKCCFELTDFGTHAAVSVVTKGKFLYDEIFLSSCWHSSKSWSFGASPVRKWRNKGV